MLQSQSYLIRVTFGEPDGDEDGVEVVKVEVGDCAAESEASGGERFVGDCVGGGGG